jgi:hypothetical protein
MSSKTSIEDDLKTGWPSITTDNDHVEKVCAVIRETRPLTVREISELVVPQNLDQKLEMHHGYCNFLAKHESIGSLPKA